MKTIPLIDLQALLADIANNGGETLKQLRFASEAVGFFALVNHGIDLVLITNLRSAIEDYFQKPVAEKQRMEILSDNYRGYIPMASFTPNQDEGLSDLYEGYKLHFEIPDDDPICNACDLYGPNRWPEAFPSLKLAVTEYWQAMNDLSEHLLEAFALMMGLPASVLLQTLEKPLTNMTLLHYPPAKPNESSFGIHPHKDTDLFTLLYPDAVGGLALKTRAGDWIEATGPDDAIIVNSGNMLETWSGGRILSTPHRVINSSGKERYSFPYFVVPRYDVMIEPLVEPLPDFEWTAVSSGFILIPS